MTISDLFFRTLEFFFNSDRHFLQLILLVLLLRGTLQKWFMSIRSNTTSFITAVKLRYQSKIVPESQEKIKKETIPSYIREIQEQKRDRYNDGM